MPGHHESLPGYRSLLGEPGRLAFVVPGAIGRLPLAMRGLGCVLLIQGYTDSYGLAGAIGAVQTVVNALAGPRLGRLADRRSHRLVLSLALLVQAVATVALVWLAAGSGPVVPLAIAAALLGGSAMPFPSISRAIWSDRLTRGPALERAFAVESVLDQVAFIVGPFAVILLAVEVSPAAGLLGSLLVTAAATVGFLRLPSLGAEERAPDRAPTPVIRIRGMQVLALAFVGLGALYGAVEVGLVAFAEEQGRPGAASVLVGLFAGGSLVGAVAYGARTWRSPVSRRATIAFAWLWLATVPIAFAPGLGWSAVAILVAGVAISPGEIAAFTLVEQLVPEGARTEGFTWILAAISAGAALGVALAGIAIDADGARAGLLVAVGGGALAVASLVLGAPALRRPRAVMERTGLAA
jgi:MFS family permease